MTGFSADWLGLREPFDRSAREASSADFDLPALARRLRGGGSALGVMDLACGTGANLRELAPRLGGSQRWLLVDHDAALLAATPGALAAWAAPRGIAVRTVDGQLGLVGPDWQAEVQLLHLDLAGGLAALPFGGVALVTTSALLDLVSTAWLDALLSRVQGAKAALLLALTVDGRVEWTPKVAGDDRAARLFEAHQRRDKGFGPALGSAAVDHAVERLRALGYGVERAASDWSVDGSQGEHARAMLGAMVEGNAAAAREQDATAADALIDWVTERRRLLSQTHLRVGHCDLLATLS